MVEILLFIDTYYTLIYPMSSSLKINLEPQPYSSLFPAVDSGKFAKMAATVNLPEDLLMGILLRLPVKSMLRFRVVSKSWFHLLKNPSFIEMHLKLSLARDDEQVIIMRCPREESKSLLSVHSSDEFLSVLVPNLEIHSPILRDTNVRFIGCCNGIVCLSNYIDFVLFNPAIREFRALPRPSGPEVGFWYTQRMGFGYDPVSNDYKVVRFIWMVEYDAEPPHKIEIYNLSSNTWREIDVNPPTKVDRHIGAFNLFFNGRLHFEASNEEGVFILSFNMSTEVFHELFYPEASTIFDEEMLQDSCLAVIHDTLSVILFTNILPGPRPSYEQFINIWMMKEYGNKGSWSKQYSLGPLTRIELPITVWKNKRLLLERVTQDTEDEDFDVELVGCDILNYDKLQNYDVHGLVSTIGVIFYKETLVSITEF